MQDPSPQIVKLCELWWNNQNISKDQSLFKPNGKLYVKESHNATRCWVWQIDKFLHTEFEYKLYNNKIQTFKPIDLDDELKNRLISQLGVGIGLFYRDFLYFYKQYKIR